MAVEIKGWKFVTKKSGMVRAIDGDIELCLMNDGDFEYWDDEMPSALYFPVEVISELMRLKSYKIEAPNSEPVQLELPHVK